MSDLIVKIAEKCSRCPKEYNERSVSLAEAQKIQESEKKAHPEAEIFRDGKSVVKYDKLCPSCKVSVGNYLSQVTGNKDEYKPSGRGRKKKEDTASVSNTTPANGAATV